MLPGNGIGDVDKECFTTDTQYAFQHTGLNTNDIKEYIRNPHKFNIKLEMDGKYYNLCSTDNDRLYANDEVVIKSVYDPSPVGYSLPASNAFTGFTTTGQNIGNPNQSPTPEQRAKFNVKDGFDKGWYFYTKPNKQGNIFWFPACGSRSFITGSLEYVSAAGYCWTAGVENGGRAIELAFDINFIFPIDTDPKTNSHSVRSAEEKKWRCVVGIEMC
ncbi:MAG: hypothetical protein ACTTGX_06565 [Candidatus Cryptobacteroides sp.]